MTFCTNVSFKDLVESDPSVFEPGNARCYNKNFSFNRYLQETGHLLFHDAIVDIGGDDGDVDDVAALLDDQPNVLVLHPHHVLPVDLQQVVGGQQTISENIMCIILHLHTYFRWEFVNNKNLAADELVAIEVILPSLNWNPMWPRES